MTYANSLHNEFMIDDYGLILEPTLIHHPKHLWQMIFRADHPEHGTLAHYRPVSDIVRTFLYAWFGHEPFGYHMANVILLSVFCSLVFLFVFILTKDLYAGLFTGLLMAVHPINTMTVNYITAHEVILYGIFGLSSLISFLGYLAAPAQPSRRAFYILSLLFFLLSFLTQEIMMMLPAYIVLVFIFYRGLRFKPLLQAMIPFAVVAGLYIAWRMGFASIKTNLLHNVLQFNISFGQYAATLLALIGWYISKLIFPHEIIFLWNMTPLSGPAVLLVLLIGTAVAVSFLLYIRKADAWIRFGGYLFVLGLLPVALLCLVYPPMGLIIEPHWFLIPSIGYFMFIAVLLAKSVRRSAVMIVVACLLAGLWMVKTIGYNVIWRTQKSYCQYWLKISPDNHGPNFWLAYSYLKEKDYVRAQEYFQRALVNGFMDWQVYLNLGLIAYYQGDDQQAIAEYNKALQLNPRSGVIYNNIGLLYQRRGEIVHAERAFRSAIDQEYFLLEPRWNLALIYEERGDWESAIKCLEDAYDLDPTMEQTLYPLAKGYLQTKRSDKLKVVLERFLRYGHNPAWLVDIANLLAQRKANDLALLYYRHAVAVDPTNVMVYREVGKFFGNTERLKEAISVWEYGLRLAPEDKELRSLIAEAQRLLGQPN